MLMPEPGRMLSHYRLVEKIGEGGMGVVWKAIDTKLGRPVALKLLPAELTTDPDRRRRFLREARTAAAVTHPNIVTIHEIDEVDGVVFLCMELVEGRTLRSVIAGRPMPIPEALRVATEIAEGLARAHEDGIVHRDLKPDNVILAPDGHAKIVDFGLAKLVEQRQEAFRSQLSRAETRVGDLTQERAVLGTVSYMSPEQARGDAVDTRSDIFSFGIVLYEMVTGRSPFKGQSQIETLAAILHEPAAPASRFNAEVPVRLEEVLGKCLEKDPGRRYQSSRDLVVDLKRLGRDLESGIASSYEAARVARPLLRRPWRAAALVAAAVVVVGGALLVLRPDRPAPVAVRPAHERSEIAVLPFQNLSGEESQAYFAGGLHDELLTQLSKVAALKVISRTSVMGYQGTTKPLKQIADELGVGSVVEGSVQVLGDRLRVNVQLIDATTDEHLWAERYDRTLDDAFAIQSEVAQRIVAAVGAAVTNAEQGRLTAIPTTNEEAYRLYLQGREYWLRPGYARMNIEIAGQMYERALGLDPDFALAHAALAQVHGLVFYFRWDTSAARVASMRREAEAALRLAPDLPEAHIAMAFVHDRADQDFPRALAELKLALKDRPNDAELWQQIGYTSRRLGNWNQALTAFEKAAQLNPRNSDVFQDLGGWTYSFLHRYAEAVRECDHALSLAPDQDGVWLRRGQVFVLWQGQLDSLRAAIDRAPAASDWTDRAEFLLLERDADSLLQLPEIRSEVWDDLWNFKPGPLYAGWAHELKSDSVAARAAFHAARERLDLAMEERPDDWRIHAARGMALAGLGLRDEARAEARWLEHSTLYRGNAILGMGLAGDRALILAEVGDAEAALDEVERLLVGPSLISVHTLRLDPRWDPIRENPRFKALMAKYSPEPAS